MQLVHVSILVQSYQFQHTMYMEIDLQYLNFNLPWILSYLYDVTSSWSLEQLCILYFAGGLELYIVAIV